MSKSPETLLRLSSNVLGLPVCLSGFRRRDRIFLQVFVTFESDLSQARCLSHMSRGILDAPEEQHMYTNPDGKATYIFQRKCGLVRRLRFGRVAV